MDPLSIAALVTAGISVGSKVGSMLTKKDPYTKYKLDTPEYNPMLSRLPGYQIKAPKKEGYTYTPGNQWSKALDTTSQVSGALSAVAGGAAALGVGAGTAAAGTGTTVAGGVTEGAGMTSVFQPIATEISKEAATAALPTLTSPMNMFIGSRLGDIGEHASTELATKTPSFMDQVKTFKEGSEKISKPLAAVNKGIDYVTPKTEPLKQTTMVDVNNTATEEEQPTVTGPFKPVMQGGQQFTFGVNNQSYLNPSLSGIGAGVVPNTVSKGISNPSPINMNSINDMIQKYINKSKLSPNQSYSL